MSGHDLYADDFPPHGTTSGYAAGCHSGGACPGKLERGQTCVQAQQRYASDWGYRKAVDARQELAFLDGETVAIEPPKPRAVAPKPVPRPRPPAPAPVVDVEEASEVVGPSISVAKSQGAFASHPKQRDHALATASEEYPMGLTLAGEPRRRCAPGTVLVGGVLRRSDEVTEAELEAAAVPVEAAPEPEPEPEVVVAEPTRAAEEQPRPRGRRLLQESLLTLTESIEMQRGVLVVMERALRTTRQEVIQLRKELEEQEQA